MDNDYIVFDLETSVKQKDKKFFPADPFYKLNKIVLYCGKTVETGVEAFYNPSLTSLTRIYNKKVIVGHNVKFDFLHVFMNCDVEYFNEWVRNGGRIWDTMLAEYMISAQRQKFPSLDYCAEKYGGTLKDDKIKWYWNNGVDTEDIPVNELKEYGILDVENTDLIYRKQMEYLQECPTLFVNILAQMDAVMATLIMEWNGMHFSKSIAANHEKTLKVDKMSKETTLENLFKSVHSNFPSTGYEINFASSQQLKSLIWGVGDIKYEVREPLLDANGAQVVWKSGAAMGQPRYKTTKLKWTPEEPDWVKDFFNSKYCKTNVKATGEEVLKNIEEFLKAEGHNYSDSTTWVNIITILLYIRGLNKEIGTYLVGYSNVCRSWGTIHPSYNHCATATGRLSCSGPNLQNVTKKEL